MKINVGLKFKAIEGVSKGKTFKVVAVNDKTVEYISEFTAITYSADRKHFEKFIKRVNDYWNKKNKEYKNKKQELKK